jgi:hypothetical protein
MLNQSPLFIDIIKGHTPEVFFIVNGHEHHMKYYFTDGIYPSWPMFMKDVHVLNKRSIDSSQLIKHR